MLQRLVKGLSVGDLHPSTDIMTIVGDDVNSDWYSSIFLYREDQRPEFYEIVDKINKKTGKHYQGKNGSANISDVVTNRIVFDFDDEENPDNSRLDTLTVIKNLEPYVDIDSIEITFSGSKGFGLEFRSEQLLTPVVLKELCRYFSEGCGSFDDSIYKYTQPLRVVGTKHPKTGLYKTPLSFDELQDLSIEEIKELATSSYEGTTFVNVKLPTDILDKIEASIEEEEIKSSKPTIVSTSLASSSVPLVVDDYLDLSQKPKWMSNWRYALLCGWFPPGSRNDALMILASTCKNYGYPKEVTHRLVKGSVELQSNRHGQPKYSSNEIWQDIILQIYSTGWKGGIYSEDKFSDKLVRYFEKNDIPRHSVGEEGEKGVVLTVDESLDIFEDFATNIDANTIKTNVAPLDQILRITTSMMVGVLAAPGAGKTTFVLNMLSAQKEANLFFSFDMGAPLLMMRSANKWSGMTNDQVFDVFRNKNKIKIHQIREDIKSNLPNTSLCFKVGSDVSSIEKYLDMHEAQTGVRVKTLIVDYLEKVKGPFSEQSANSSKAAAELQELATKKGLCVLVLLQPQKSAGDPSIPLRSYRKIKGASVIEQDCRVVITMFREGYNPEFPEDDRFITFCVAKNNLGPLGEVDCYWDGETGNITEIDDAGRIELRDIRKANAEAREADL